MGKGKEIEVPSLYLSESKNKVEKEILLKKVKYLLDTIIPSSHTDFTIILFRQKKDDDYEYGGCAAALDTNNISIIYNNNLKSRPIIICNTREKDIVDAYDKIYDMKEFI